MRRFVLKQWFLLGLLVLIPAGLWFGGANGVESAADGPLGWLLARFPRYATMVILFLMSFTLDSRQLGTSFRYPLPVLWASLVNYAFVPLLCWPLQGVQLSADFAIGLMIAASAPCTMAAASVWTRRAGGNDAVSLVVTLLTNTVCFAVAPFWLEVTTGNAVRMDLGRMIWRLVGAVLVPTLLGQTSRLAPRLAEFATRRKKAIGVVAQSLILVVVLTAAVRAGDTMRGRAGGPGFAAVAVVWGTVVAVHVAAMLVAVSGGRLFGFSRGDRIATAFAGSQKTLPIGLLLATDPAMFGDPNLLGPGVGVPFAVFPIMMYHASQLFLDTVVADRMAAGSDAATGAESETPGVPSEPGVTEG